MYGAFACYGSVLNGFYTREYVAIGVVTYREQTAPCFSHLLLIEAIALRLLECFIHGCCFFCANIRMYERVAGRVA